ncbi:MAG: helix-turn-helix transcriptional regulator [Bacteroidota bacterium]
MHSKLNEQAQIPMPSNNQNINYIGVQTPHIIFQHHHCLKNLKCTFLDESARSILNSHSRDQHYLQDFISEDDWSKVRDQISYFKHQNNHSNVLTLFYRLKIRKKTNNSPIVVTTAEFDKHQSQLKCCSMLISQKKIGISRSEPIFFETQDHEIASTGINKLTDREKEICQLLIEGKLVKEIADELSRSSRTIEQHKKNIYKKLGINNLNGLYQKTYFIDHNRIN